MKSIGVNIVGVNLVGVNIVRLNLVELSRISSANLNGLAASTLKPIPQSYADARQWLKLAWQSGHRVLPLHGAVKRSNVLVIALGFYTIGKTR